MLNVGSGVIRRHSPVREEWVDDIQTACRRTGTAFFFKQWGGVRKDKTGRQYRGRTFGEMTCAAEPLIA
jgi:protein gp37